MTDIQYTIRGVPLEVDRILRQKAAERQQSLNQVIVDELTKAIVGGSQRSDFTDLAGQWNVIRASTKPYWHSARLTWISGNESRPGNVPDQIKQDFRAALKSRGTRFRFVNF